MTNPLSKFGLTDMELDAEIARNPEVIRELEDLAHKVEEFWKGIAPVFSESNPREHRKTPPYPDEVYRDSIHTEMIRDDKGKPAARVGTRDYKAVWIELGSRHMPEYAPATQTGHYFGDTTGPIVSVGGHNENINSAQGRLREAVEKLAKLKAEGASSRDVSRQQTEVTRARGERSAAFRAARPRRGRR